MAKRWVRPQIPSAKKKELVSVLSRTGSKPGEGKISQEGVVAILRKEKES